MAKEIIVLSEKLKEILIQNKFKLTKARSNIINKNKKIYLFEYTPEISEYIAKFFDNQIKENEDKKNKTKTGGFVWS